MLRIIYLLLFSLVTYSNANGQGVSGNPFQHADDKKEILTAIKNCEELSYSDLLRLKWTDSAFSFSQKERVYCDTSVSINDSIGYAIISLTDNHKICAHYYILLLNYKSSNLISSQYLRMDCDIDFSQKEYSLYTHKFISQDSILVCENMIVQKKRKKPDEEQNIKKIKTKKLCIIVIRSEGLIRLPSTRTHL